MTDSATAPMAFKLQAALRLRMFKTTVHVCLEAMMRLALEVAAASALLTAVSTDGTKRTQWTKHKVTVMVCCPRSVQAATMWLHRAKPVMAVVHRQALLTGKLVKSKPREVQTSSRSCSCMQQQLMSHHTRCCDVKMYKLHDATQIVPGMIDKL